MAKDKRICYGGLGFNLKKEKQKIYKNYKN